MLLVELCEPTFGAGSSKAPERATLSVNVIILDHVRRRLRCLHLVLELRTQINIIHAAGPTAERSANDAL